MNYAILLVETILICFMLILFYKQSKKNGLYLCVAVLSSILGITSYKLIDISGFQVNLGLPILMEYLFVAILLFKDMDSTS